MTPSGSRESILFQRGLHNGTAPVLYGLPSGTNLTDALNFPLAMRSAHRPVRSQQFCECLGCCCACCRQILSSPSSEDEVPPSVAAPARASGSRAGTPTSAVVSRSGSGSGAGAGADSDMCCSAYTANICVLEKALRNSACRPVNSPTHSSTSNGFEACGRHVDECSKWSG